MTLTIDEVLQIVDDDEKYVRHVNQHGLPNGAEVKILEIPRSFFTAFRLIYVSPVELSLSFKVILLGGVPDRWQSAQPNLARRESSTMESSKNIEIMSESSKDGSKKGKRKENRTSREPLPLEVQNLKNLGAVDEHFGERKCLPTSSSGSIRKLRRRTRSLVPSHTVDLCRITSSLSGQLKGSSKVLKNWRANTSLDGIILGRDLTQLHERNKKKDDSDVKENGDSLRIDPSADHGDSALISDSSIVDTHQDLQRLYHEQERNEMEMDKLLYGRRTLLDQDSQDSTVTYVSAASESELEDTSGFEKSCDGSTSVFPVVPTACISDSEQDSSRVSQSSHLFKNKKNLTLTFNVHDNSTFKNGLAERGVGNRKYLHANPVVFMRATIFSNDYKRLSLLKPNPEQLAVDESNQKSIKSDKSLVSMTGVQKLESFNAARERMISRIRQSLSRRYDSYSSYRHPDKLGSIIMMDKILVMVKHAVTQKYPIVEFSESEPIDTLVADRWCEYLVVARLTNQTDRPVFIQFCHQRHTPFFHSSSSNQPEYDSKFGSMMDFYLDKSCVVGIYSPLDKTIFIEKPDDRLASSTLEEINELRDSHLSTLKFFIFRCPSLKSTSKWLDFLQGAIGMSTVPKRISLRIPEADVSFIVHLGKYELGELDRIEASEQDTLKISYLPRGYCIFQIPLLRYLSVTLNERLRDGGYKEIVKGWEGVNVNLGCNFRYYDMINWCPGSRGTSLRNLSALFQLHVLEFRPYSYYGRRLELSNGSTLLEPTAIEGFLLRVTNYKGSDKNTLGRPHLKQVYLFTSENLLFIMQATKAVPPLPLEFSEVFVKQSDTEKVNLSFRDLPDVYEQNPYPLDLESHIEWLKGELDRDNIAIRDHYALKCFNRRILQIIKAQSVIDMTEIDEVRQGSITDMQSREIIYEVYNQVRSTIWKTQKSLNETAKSLIFIHIKGKRIIKLLAVNPTIAEEWVTRLRAHIGYWKQKHESDIMELRKTKVQNMDNLKIDEVEEANINGRAPKWVTERGVSAPSIYNINALALIRPILHRGLLHQKPKKHSIFTKYLVVLIPGFLILYHYFKRSKTDYTDLSTDHVHHMTIPIEDCYIYSGTLTGLDLLNRDKTFDEFNPGSHCLPRIYDDGWISSETENSRCFTLWFGSKRTLSRYHVNLQDEEVRNNINSSITQTPFLIDDPVRTNLKNPHIVKMIKELGITGKSMVFMARSRQERDLWVLSLQYELERLMGGR